MSERMMQQTDHQLYRHARGNVRNAWTCDGALLINRSVVGAVLRRNHVVAEIASQPAGSIHSTSSSRRSGGTGGGSFLLPFRGITAMSHY